MDWFEKIKSMSKKELAEFLAKFDIEDINSSFCKYGCNEKLLTELANTILIVHLKMLVLSKSGCKLKQNKIKPTQCRLFLMLHSILYQVFPPLL